MQELRRYSHVRNTVCWIGAGLILSGCFMEESIEEAGVGLETANELSGSVGDGPVVGAKIRVLRNDGELLADLESDFAANYNISFKTKGKYYPLTLEANDGTDMVTFLAPDFKLSSAVLAPGKKTVANINPFTTIALETAGEMPGGRNASNIKDALEIAVVQLNSGLDTLVSTSPMSAKINATNITEIVKASETLGETIRRTRDALLAVGQPATGDTVVQSLGSDLTDSVVDGIGGARADERIAAVSTIAAAQTAIESMRNQLHVNGSDATTLMTSAIENVIAGVPQLTLAELAATENVIRQARIGVIAAEQISPSSEMTELRYAVSNLQPGMLPSAAISVLPQNASQLLDNVLLAVAAGDSSTLDTVNDTARTGGAVSPENGAPTIQGSPATIVSVGAVYGFEPVADDPDGDALAFSISGKPIWANFDSLSGSLSGTPGAADIGPNSSIVISVSDGQYNTSMTAFSITVEQLATNSPPTISGSAQAMVTAGSPYDFTPTTNDADGDTLTFSINNRPVWAGFSSSSGSLTGTPGVEDEGSYGNIVIAVTDGQQTASHAPFSITVVTANSPPQISGSPTISVVAGNVYDFTPTSSDPDGDPITFSVSALPRWANFDPTNGRLFGTPDAGDVGIHGGIVITASDGRDSMSLRPFDISVESIALGSATLTWIPPTENADGSPLTDLAGYKIYWGTAQGNYPNTVTIDNPGISAYVIENLVPGTYEFVTTAINAAGAESDYSNPAIKSIP